MLHFYGECLIVQKRKKTLIKFISFNSRILLAGDMQPSSRSDVTAMYPVSKSSSRSDVTAMYPVSKSSSRSDVTAMYPVSKSPSRSDVTAVHPVSKSSSRADVNAIYSAGSDRAKIFITKSQMILCKLCLSDVQTDELYAFEHCKCTFCLSVSNWYIYNILHEKYCVWWVCSSQWYCSMISRNFGIWFGVQGMTYRFVFVFTFMF